MLTSPDLSTFPGIRHGFFTRNGGHSTGLYTSLNTGYGSGDDIPTITQNRDIIARAIGSTHQKLVTVHQTHSPICVTVTTPWTYENAPQADALATSQQGIALGVLTADCVPVLFADPTARVIAAAHAGWKGAYGGVIENTVATMEALGARREHITAAIGPAIEQKSYEVGPEFHDRLVAENPENDRFFIPSLKDAHHMFDLKAYVRSKCQAARLGPVNMLANDTCSEEDTFFSFRRATLRHEPVYGRQLSAIILE